MRSLQQLCGVENLFGTSADPVVLGQVYPADGTAGIQQKLGRPRNVVSAYTSAGVK